MQERILITENCSTLRALARQALAGKWGIAILGLILMNLLSNIPVMVINMIFGESLGIEFITMIYALIISGPLNFGYGAMSLHLFRQQPTGPSEVFYGFEKFGRAFGVYAITTLIVVICTIVVAIPVAIFIAIIIVSGQPSFLNIIIILLLYLALVLCIFAIQVRYSMVYFVMTDHPDYTVMEIIRANVKLLEGNKKKVFLLEMSFAGWFILFVLLVCAGVYIAEILGLLLMIPGLWLWVYVMQSLVAAYEIVSGNLKVNAVENTGSMTYAPLAAEPQKTLNPQEKSEANVEEQAVPTMEAPNAEGSNTEGSNADAAAELESESVAGAETNSGTEE